MRLAVSTAALALSVGVAGCSRIGEALMPVTEKVNAAYPPSPEVRIAEERLLTLLGDDAKAKDDVRARSEARMALRGLACARNSPISRTASIDAVRALGLNRDCFREQDIGLQTFYGVRTVGLLLAKAPLRPLKA